MHHQGGYVAIRKWMVVASLALVAALALTVASIGSAGSAKSQATSSIKVAVVTDVGGLNDKGFNALAAKGLDHGEEDPRRRRAGLHLEDRGRLHPEPLDGGPSGSSARDRQRLPHG